MKKDTDSKERKTVKKERYWHLRRKDCKETKILILKKERLMFYIIIHFKCNEPCNLLSCIVLYPRHTRGRMSPNAVGMKIPGYSKCILKKSDCILSAFQIFGPILVIGPNVFIMLNTFEVHSKWQNIERHSNCTLTAF